MSVFGAALGLGVAYATFNFLKPRSDAVVAFDRLLNGSDRRYVPPFQVEEYLRYSGTSGCYATQDITGHEWLHLPTGVTTELTPALKYQLKNPRSV